MSVLLSVSRPRSKPNSNAVGEIRGSKKKEPECIPKTAQTCRAISRSINNEFEIVDATGEKTANITKIPAALESIPPTSVEAERDYSAVGLFITRLRIRLSDKSVNCLSLLRAYFYSKYFVHCSNS